MLVVNVGILLLALPVCGFSPGFFIVRRFHWNPLEKLCGSIGLSFIFLYLVSFVIYWISPTGDAGDLVWTCTSWATIGFCGILAGLTLPEVTRLVQCRQVRRLLFCFAFLLIWALTVLSIIRNYSGGAWSGDWLEHFQRTLFFLHRFPASTPILPEYEVPARPPMMNLVAAFFMAPTRDDFQLFQITFAVLNSLAFLSCCLIVPAVRKLRRTHAVPVVLAMFALNPMMIQNITYTWTKLFAAFYVILGISFYLAGWRKSDVSRMVAAWASLSAAVVVHYSAVPYFLFVTLHYVTFLIWRRRAKWRELSLAASASAAVLTPWFVWSTLTYGTQLTFASNTTAEAIVEAQGSRSSRIATTFGANLVHTIVPHPLLSARSAERFAQPNRQGWMRDYAFFIYQTNAIFCLGLTGGPVVLCLLLQRWWAYRGGPPDSQARFWFLLVPFCFVLGVAVNPLPDFFGVAHVTLQPLTLLGISFLAASFSSLSRLAFVAVILGCLVDFTFGILLQARVQNYENEPGHEVFRGLVVQKDRVSVGAPGQLSPSNAAWVNWFRKHQYAASSRWLEQLNHFDGAQSLKRQLQRYRSQDLLYFDGWYTRHGGSLVFLGDELGASSSSLGAHLGILILGALGLSGTCLREIVRLPSRKLAVNSREHAK